MRIFGSPFKSIFTTQRAPRARSIASDAGLTAGISIAASAIGHLFYRAGLPETDIALAYLLAVLLTARLTNGYLFGMLSSLISAFSFNYFFMVPYFTFSMNTRHYLTTFLFMISCSLVTSALTTHARQNEIRAREKEKETMALYTLTKRLADAGTLEDIAGIAVNAVGDLLASQAGCLCLDEKGRPEPSFLQQTSPGKQIRRQTVDADALLEQMKRTKNGLVMGPEFQDWPIVARDTLFGVIRIPRETATALSGSQAKMIWTILENVALAMDRFHATQERLKTDVEITKERYRGNLLRAISHDLRTPLSSIMGTAEMLLSMTDPSDSRYSSLAEIHQEANWLRALVENILSLTRLQDGRLLLHKQLEAVEEIVGGAVVQIARRFPDYEIAVSVPDEPLFVPMDAKLIEQVLVNLLDNAVKHTPQDGEIGVTVTRDTAPPAAVFTVWDNGVGIADSDLPHVFETFYTSKAKQPDAQLGIGLGLAICDTAVKAHGGSIAARNRSGARGAEFTFTLPLEVNDHESA